MTYYRRFSLLFALTIVVNLAACIENPEYRGYTAARNNFDQIEVGETTKDEAQKLLGSPSSTSTYGEEAWYYISTFQVRKASFMQAEDRRKMVVKLTFDENDVVDDMTVDSGDQARPIDFAEDETPTEGNEMTVIEQLLGNFGKFNAPQ